MKFPSPLVRGTLIRRYKRFLADVRLDSGDETTAHVPNPGSMIGLADPGLPVWLSPAANPARKLKWTWELVEIDGRPVGVDTALANGIVAEAIAQGRIAGLEGYAGLRREVPYGRNSRIDILLSDPARPDCLVEVKTVNLSRPRPGRSRHAEFPDAVTARGTKHLHELADAHRAGRRAVMLYLVLRMDCERFSLATDIDPAYAEAFAESRRAGVEAFCAACRVAPDGIEVDRALPLDV